MIMLTISFSVSGLLHGEAGLLGWAKPGAGCRGVGTRLERLGALGWDVDSSR